MNRPSIPDGSPNARPPLSDDARQIQAGEADALVLLMATRQVNDPTPLATAIIEANDKGKWYAMGFAETVARRWVEAGPRLVSG
jgi:hypothetical protein